MPARNLAAPRREPKTRRGPARAVIRDRHLVQALPKSSSLFGPLADVVVTGSDPPARECEESRETESVGAGTHPNESPPYPRSRCGAMNRRRAPLGRPQCRAESDAPALKADPTAMDSCRTNTGRLGLLVTSAESGPEKLMVHPRNSPVFSCESALELKTEPARAAWRPRSCRIDDSLVRHRHNRRCSRRRKNRGRA